jgi:hypothetical protein
MCEMCGWVSLKGVLARGYYLFVSKIVEKVSRDQLFQLINAFDQNRYRVTTPNVRWYVIGTPFNWDHFLRRLVDSYLSKKKSFGFVVVVSCSCVGFGNNGGALRRGYYLYHIIRFRLL